MVDLLTPWRTPAGTRFLLAPSPWTRNLLLMWDAAHGVWDWPDDLAVMPAMDARDYLARAENAHVRHGFYVLPGWRGLHLPDTCPAGVALDLQACFLTSSYGGGR